VTELHAARRRLFSILTEHHGREFETAPAGGVTPWQSLFEFADSWRVLPPLRRRISDLGLSLSAAETVELTARWRRVFAFSASVCGAGARISASMTSSGIPHVLFKGVAAIAQIYGGPDERTTVDADVLIGEQDLPRAIDALHDLGLRPSDGGDLSGYRRAIRNMPGFAGNQAITLTGGPLQHLDLHWSLGAGVDSELAAEKLIARGVPRNLLGTEVHVVSPVDGFLLGAHHAMRNNFAPDRMVRDVLDAARWLDVLQRQGALGEVIARAQRCRLRPAVFGLAVLAGREPALAELSCPDGFDLVELFRLQLEEPLGNDLATLVDPHALTSILRGALGNWREYRKYLSHLDVENKGTAQSVKGRIAAVFANLRALRGERGKAYRALRTLARVRAAYQRAG